MNDERNGGRDKCRLTYLMYNKYLSNIFKKNNFAAS